MVSHGSAFPIELPPPPAASARGRSFAAGVAVGLIVAAIAAQAWLGVHLAPMASSWEAFTPDSIAATSRLAVSDAWRCGAPAATAMTLAAMLLAGVRRARWYGLLAAVAVGVTIATYVWATAPWSALAGAVR